MTAVWWAVYQAFAGLAVCRANSEFPFDLKRQRDNERQRDQRLKGVFDSGALAPVELPSGRHHLTQYSEGTEAAEIVCLV
ncbi:hypothetical protein F5Y07DRAFT_124736 [Xylaria sp. FL0933]|nr:hypothetical protein F5Y07DRAFT_124736 [Xylaria sp. FL0933]